MGGIGLARAAVRTVAMMVSCLVSSSKVFGGPRMFSTRWPVFVSIRTLEVLVTVECGAGSQGDNRRRVVSLTRLDRSRWVWDRRGGGGHGFARATLAPLSRSATLADRLIWPKGSFLLVRASSMSFEKEVGAGRLAGHKAATTSRWRSALDALDAPFVKPMPILPKEKLPKPRKQHRKHRLTMVIRFLAKQIV